ncbi:DUF4258 domain-containing protein [Mesorhizobium sp.]|uniref:DUF4258 domain-containing protein n=1 Tax=Mesorhizobium sp. TaxID=1871066 RepID=UPI0025BE3A65|nr:DUF4258 domain-containing protein [Mesorhizobium sp.]
MAFENECGRLRRLARSGARVRYTNHALEEMEKDRIFRIDVENMLPRCQVTKVEPTGFDETWRAEGRDSNGRLLVAVVVAEEEIRVIRVITSWIRKRQP